MQAIRGKVTPEVTTEAPRISTGNMNSRVDKAIHHGILSQQSLHLGKITRPNAPNQPGHYVVDCHVTSQLRGNNDWVAGNITHLFRQLKGFLDQGFDDLGFRDSLDYFTAHENLTFAITRRNSKVSLTSFTRPIHNATHNSDAQRDI
jgi:hypothetical protein